MKKTIIAIILMVGLVFSGCNSTLKESPKKNKNSKKTSSTESSVYSEQNTSNTLVQNSLDKVDTEQMVEAVKPDRDLIYEKCSYPIIRDIYEGAKDRIAAELNKIEYFDVKLEYNKEYYDQTEKKLHSVWNPGDGEEYTIEVSQIEFDADKLYICDVYGALRVEGRDGWKDLPTGLVVIMGVDVKITGKNTTTGEDVVYVGSSCFYATCLGITVTTDTKMSHEDGDEEPEIVDPGDIVYHFETMNRSYEWWTYRVSWQNSPLPTEKYRSDPTIWFDEVFWSTWDTSYHAPEDCISLDSCVRYHNQWMEKIGCTECEIAPTPTPEPTPTPIPVIGDDGEYYEDHSDEYYDERDGFWHIKGE